jgi:catechol 2,3-dioxygenase-like lactoylglutathione lyase family enzyme
MTETRHETRIPERHGGFRPKEYAHVVFRTAQPEALIDWYCKVLGMQVVMRHPAISFLTWDGSQDRLAVISEPNAPVAAPNSAGFHHAAYEIENLRELIGQYRTLKKQGIIPEQCLNHGVATSMYYRDPDNNQIELTVGSFKTVDDLNEWLATGALDINPLGVFLDPEELAARVDSGEPEEEILKPHPQHTEHAAALTDMRRAAATPQPAENVAKTSHKEGASQ